MFEVDGDDIKGYNKVGFNVGAIVYSKIDEHIAASLEILYSQKGSRLPSPVELNQGEYITNYKINLNYAEVPVLINYFDRRKSNFGGGFSLSRLATSYESLTIAPARSIDLNKFPFNKYDLNIVLGGNLHLYQGFFANIRFQYSLISIRNHIPTDTQTGSQYNNMWVIRLMYLF